MSVELLLKSGYNASVSSNIKPSGNLLMMQKYMDVIHSQKQLGILNLYIIEILLKFAFANISMVCVQG